MYLYKVNHIAAVTMHEKLMIFNHSNSYFSPVLFDALKIPLMLSLIKAGQT
jgi:hypothetical protein